jgi:hypothetical protein
VGTWGRVRVREFGHSHGGIGLGTGRKWADGLVGV